jgi:hypothetical protein
MQAAGGAPGGTKVTHETARRLAARTGRPTIHNLASQPIEPPEEWQEHPRCLEASFKAGARVHGPVPEADAQAVVARARALSAVGVTSCPTRAALKALHGGWLALDPPHHMLADQRASRRLARDLFA